MSQKRKVTLSLKVDSTDASYTTSLCFLDGSGNVKVHLAGLGEQTFPQDDYNVTPADTFLENISEVKFESPNYKTISVRGTKNARVQFSSDRCLMVAENDTHIQVFDKNGAYLNGFLEVVLKSTSRIEAV